MRNGFVDIWGFIFYVIGGEMELEGCLVWEGGGRGLVCCF